MEKLKIQLTFTGNRIFDIETKPHPDEHSSLLDWDEWWEDVECKVGDELYKEGWDIDDLSINVEYSDYSK